MMYVFVYLGVLEVRSTGQAIFVHSHFVIFGVYLVCVKNGRHGVCKLKSMPVLVLLFVSFLNR